MSVRQPKSISKTIIEVVGRPGGKKGRLELTSGNVKYFRMGAQSETLSLTYQQLVAVLEKEVEFQSINVSSIKLPKPHVSGDFTLVVDAFSEDDDNDRIINAASSINTLEPKYLAMGTCQFRSESSKGRRSKRFGWCAEISIQAALWMINCYIDKFLSKKKLTTYTDSEVVVSKVKMREVILMLLKKLD